MSKEGVIIKKYTNKELADLLNADFSTDKDALVKVVEMLYENKKAKKKMEIKKH